MDEIVNINDFVPDAHNANKGTERGQLAVNTSVKQSGAGRSILVDRDGNVMGGNKTLQAAKLAGLDVQIVRTDGKRLVAVMREDLSIDSPEGRLLAIADNRTAELGLEWDAGELNALIDSGMDLGGLWDDFELEALGVFIPEFDIVPEEEQPSLDKLSPVICPHCGENINE